MTAYAYLRKSAVHDPAREVSYEVQEAAVREMARRYGDEESLTLLSDWDKSGRLGADRRPGYRALLEAIESGRATAIYSYSLSRLARSVPELSRLIADCVQRGIPVRLDRDHVDTSTASGMLLAHVLSAVAQFESDVASERVRGANAAKLVRGESLTTVPLYGDREGEDAAAVVAAFREAGSYSGAAKLLNARGIKPRNSRRGWWPSSVNVVIRRLLPDVGRRREQGVRAGGTDFLFAGVLHCPTCGTRLTGARDRREILVKKRGTPPVLGPGRVRYSCRLGTALPHPRISVSEHLILPAIRAEADRLRAPSEVETEAADKAQRAELEQRRARVLDLFEAGHIDRADRERRLAAVHEALGKLADRQVIMAVPTLDWTRPTAKVNAVIRALFESVDLDPVTFQPVAFTWTVPEWRS